MKKIVNTKSLLVLIVLVFAASVLFAGCASNKNTDGATTTVKTADSSPALKGSITLSGSTSVQPLTQVLADAFNEKNPDVKIDVQVGGSSTGVKNASTNASNIGNSSRELKEEEKGWGLTEYKIAIDGIAVVVNPKNAVVDLTKDQVVKIFKGEITNWKSVGGADKQIVVVSREAGSGTRGAFEELLPLTGKDDKGNAVSLVKETLIANENGVVKATVSSKEDAIGYLSIGYIDKTIKGVKLDSVDATAANILANKYALSRPFLMLTKGELKPEVKAFLDFILGDEGQKVVEAEGYIKVK